MHPDFPDPAIQPATCHVCDGPTTTMAPCNEFGFICDDCDLLPECPRCAGVGSLDDSGDLECPRCFDTGKDVNAATLKAAIGKWPGDETDEQISQALDELS